MPKIDVVDEAIIDADPNSVFVALVAEFEGAKKWWSQHWEAKPRGTVPFSQIGGIIDITVHRIGTPKFTAKSTEIIPNKLVRADFIEGDFLGNGEWTLTPVSGKTKIAFRFNVKTNRLLFSAVNPVMSIAKIHSDVMQKGLALLNDFLNQNQQR